MLWGGQVALMWILPQITHGSLSGNESITDLNMLLQVDSQACFSSAEKTKLEAILAQTRDTVESQQKEIMELKAELESKSEWGSGRRRRSRRRGTRYYEYDQSVSTGGWCEYPCSIQPDKFPSGCKARQVFQAADCA